MAGDKLVRSDPALPARQESEPPILDLLRAAVDKGMDPAALEKLVGLYERVKDRQAASEFTAALLEFQKKCPSVRKNKQASFPTKAGTTFSYTFASLDEICRTVNPILHPLGLTYKWDSSLSDDGGRMRITATLNHVAGHSVAATFEAPVDKGTGTSAAQDYAKVLTFGERMSLIQVLGLFTADEDTDAAPGERITDAQRETIYGLMAETKTTLGAFLEWAGVETLEALPSVMYGPAVRSLEQKRKAVAARAAAR